MKLPVLFKRQEVEFALPVDGNNPYLNGRREWNERYGSYVARALTWRIFSLVELAVIVVLVFALQSIARQARVQPFIVEVDKLGETVATKAAEPLTKHDPKVIRYQLGEAIGCAKFITSDATVQKQCLDRLYAMSGPEATGFLNDWFKKHNPFSQPRPDETIVNVRTVLALSDSTWEIQWEEIQKPSNGTADIPTYWRAVVTLKFYDATTEAQLRANPASMLIDTINWTQQL